MKPGTLTVVAQSCYMRPGPGTECDFKEAGKVYVGEAVLVIEGAAANAYRQSKCKGQSKVVNRNGVTGWIYDDLLDEVQSSPTK